MLNHKEDLMNGNIEVRDDGNGPYISKWQVAAPQPSNEELETLASQYLKEKSIEGINAIAYSKIINIAPEYKQRNMIARATELLEKSIQEPLNNEEQAERLYIKDIWERVKVLRSHAAYLKAEVEAGNNPDINEGWSE